MSTINYENSLATADAKAAADAREAQNREVWENFILNKYLLADNQANYQILREFSSGQMTVESAEYVIKNRPTTLCWTTREALIEELASTLRSRTTTKTLSDYDWKNRVVRMTTWSLKQLRAYRRELEFKAEHPTAQQAKNYLAEVRKPEEPKEIPEEITASMIKAMPPWQIKKLIRDYSAHAVNNRLFGRG